MSIKMVATCLFGLEKLLGEELDALGVKRLETIDGRIVFEGEEADIPRLNIGLRCAERVFILMGDFLAPTFDTLFEGTKALPWEEWIGKNDAFPISGHSIKSALTSIPACQKIVNKALADRLGAAYGLSWLPQNSGVTYAVEFFLLKDRAMLLIDTSGAALHKRGYRPHANAAPLRETLAAAMVLSARPREDVLIWDPFCGSGTIAIEAAMILTNRAPGLNRSFASEQFARLPASLWEAARAQARAAIKTDSTCEVWASDLDEDALDLTYENALRAGVEEYLNIFSADARQIEKPDRRGTILCNPPYGERLMTPEEVEALYREMGRHFASFDPWQIYVLTSHEGFERLYGRRADKIRKLYNGMIPCYLYQFFKPAAAREDMARREHKKGNEHHGKQFSNKRGH
ncbi:MAG: class I SAM-dependent RNA methyltransferase [Clostridia bacterium]|nr:class I SAM-dependent RNA methyltransferase [Clostridia bacterium]